MSDLDRIVSQLEALVDELDELSFDTLQEASADGAGTRPDSDRVITQARRAIEKAARLLRGAGDVDP